MTPPSVRATRHEQVFRAISGVGGAGGRSAVRRGAHWGPEVVGMPRRPFTVELAEIDMFCRARFPDHHYRVTVDRQTRRFTVHRLPSAELDETVRAEFGDWDLAFADAPHSSAELTAVRNRIRALQPEWSARGVVFNGITTEADGSAVVVHVAGDEVALAQFEAVLRTLPVRLRRNGAVLL